MWKLSSLSVLFMIIKKLFWQNEIRFIWMLIGRVFAQKRPKINLDLDVYLEIYGIKLT